MNKIISPNRSKQPAIKLIGKVNLLKPAEKVLDNGVPFYSFNAGTQDIIKIECIFDAGTWYQDKKLVAFSTIKMLTEGTKKHTASELAEFFDTYGAFVEVEAEKDYTNISLYCLTKHLQKLLPVFSEMIKESIFPKHELDVLLANTKQDLLTSMQRVSYIARVKFAEQLFGNKHPYGQNAAVEDYDNVSSDDLVDFHKKYYHPANLRIVASGKVDNSVLSLINDYLGNKNWKAGKKAVMKAIPVSSSKEKTIVVTKKGALQSGIRIGKILFTKQHPDYFGVTVLNTLLGGYFGSRLMTNIREDKGYTYGIGSGMASLKNAGYIFIASEVKAEVRELAVKEIYNELELLRNKSVSKQELDLVKNYMMGSFLRSIDGPFALSERFVGIMDYGFDFSEYYNRYIHTIKTITPKQIIDLANRYLQANTFSETIAGK
jgi:predicted Zn-dependent peptidase